MFVVKLKLIIWVFFNNNKMSGFFGGFLSGPAPKNPLVFLGTYPGLRTLTCAADLIIYRFLLF